MTLMVSAACFQNQNDNDNLTDKCWEKKLLSFEDQGDNRSDCTEFANTFSQREEIEQILTINKSNKKDLRNPGMMLILFCVFQTFIWFDEGNQNS